MENIVTIDRCQTKQVQRTGNENIKSHSSELNGLRLTGVHVEPPEVVFPGNG